MATFATHRFCFSRSMLPLALGIGFGHPTVSALVSRAGRSDEQGRVQGAAGAVESRSRHRAGVGAMPLWLVMATACRHVGGRLSEC